MKSLLILPLVFALFQPVTSQVYVNSSSHDGSSRASTPKQTDQTQSPPPTSRTVVPFGIEDQGMSRGTRTESVMGKNVSVEVSKQGNFESNGHPEEHTITGETSTYPSNIDIKVELTTHLVSPSTKGGLTKPQRPMGSTTPIQHIKGHFEKATTEAQMIDEGSGHTLLQGRPIVAATESETKIHESSDGDWSASDRLIPTVVSLMKSSLETIGRDVAERAQYRAQAQTAYSILTTLSSAQKRPTVSVVLQPKPSTSTLVNEKPATASPPNVMSPRVTVSLADEERGGKLTPTHQANCRPISNC